MGLAIENTITGFESCRIRVKNIPRDARQDEIAALFTQQGLNMFEFHVVSVKDMPGRNGKQEADIVTNADVAQALAIGLEGLEFRDERLEFEVGMFNAPGAMGALAPRDENTLVISCRAPIRPLCCRLSRHNFLSYKSEGARRSYMCRTAGEGGNEPTPPRACRAQLPTKHYQD